MRVVVTGRAAPQPLLRGGAVKYVVRVLCLGMLSQPKEFDTEEEAEQYAKETRRIPGMVPLVEEAER
jgi:hypothetical protein